MRIFFILLAAIIFLNISFYYCKSGVDHSTNVNLITPENKAVNSDIKSEVKATAGNWLNFATHQPKYPATALLLPILIFGGIHLWIKKNEHHPLAKRN